ncbi:hypothetical protein [Nafulsella turpanensis]|uniref:hypothetical protein n=1 Tax=Nafulsella turpanensis TaxID=1265690 RepID=UPI0003458AC2|nr:hypothetical protein [Nafulsella turpanensis]
MKKLKLFLLLPFFYACSDPCSGLECLSEDFFYFTIKSDESGEDLVLGSEAQISEEDIEVFYLTDGTRESVEFSIEPQGVLVYLHHELHEELYVSALGKTDTINVQLRRVEPSECCPAVTEMEGLSLNGEPQALDSQLIKLYR